MTAFRTRTSPQRARLTAVLLTSTMLSGVPQLHAQTLPTGGSVAAGSAAIGTASNGALTVTQSSASAVVNWHSFSVGQGNAVNFVQPSSTSAILNRVTGSATSNIAGQINANGSVYLVNPNGIAITSTGTVNAAGFVASTLGISDGDFMSGKRTFTGNGASASVSNAGRISIGRGGYAALLGGSVDNAGSITVPLGKVGLGSGEQATLDLSGDGFMQVAVPTSAPGTRALVSNSGKISANGGTVQLSAAAARDMARQAINMSGIIEARSVGGRNGAIVLGGSGGSVAISGKLIASSRRSKGGSITVTGRDIKLSGATLDASGKRGGGTIRIGGDRQGQGTLQHAETVSIDASTTIKADAISSGNGGNVVVWSDLLTTFAGTISARGGALSGDGGEAEVSGNATLAYTGFSNLSAANGSFGTLLLDPYNVTISSAADSGGFTAAGNDSVINVGTLQTALSGANVTVSTGVGGSQAGDVTVADAIAWRAGTTLTLNAANHINVNAGITFGAAGAGLILNATNALVINAPITVNGAGAVTLTYNAGSASNLSFGLGSGFAGGLTFANADGSAATASAGGTLAINGRAYSLLYAMSDVSNVNNALGGRYAVATNIDAGGPVYTTGVIAGGSTPFSGVFEGLGHTIANLTIAAPSNSDAVGLIGYSSGTVRDIGVVGGSVYAHTTAGDLVGNNIGSVTNAYATGAVSGDDNAGGLGGLVGVNTGGVTNAYATGAVSGGASSRYLGGLVGYNGTNASVMNAYATGAVTSGDHANFLGGLVGFNQSTVTNAYATGAVSGGASSLYLGGLVGFNPGTVTNVYATGAVSGGSSSRYLGGLVGAGGTVTNGYWDTQTSGQSQSSGGTGLSTAQFQNATSASALGGAFTLSSGLYPYLTSFFPNGVQAISGTAYADAGVTVAASGALGPQYVYVDIAGRQTAVTTGANGYYYIALSNGTLSAANGGTATLAYTLAGNVTGPVSGAHLVAATATTAHLDVWGHTLIAPTVSTSLSTAPTTAVALLAANGAADQILLAAAAGGDTAPTSAVLGALGSVGYVATAASGFIVDQGISANGLYLQTTQGPLTVNTAQTLGGPINLTLLSAGALAINAPIEVDGAGSVTLAYDASSATNMTFGLTGSGFTGGLTFANADGSAATASAGGTLAINGQAYTLLYAMSDVANVNNALGGAYAVATDIDAGSTVYTTAVIAGSGTPFSGAFEGLGHTIANLTINAPSSSSGVGLIGYSTGTVRDIGVVGGSVYASTAAGGLVGVNSGTVTNAYATGAVSGGDNATSLGGLIGVNNPGTVTNVYATGAVSGGASSRNLGGLVGANASSLTNAYATGAVSGGALSLSLGGLVGANVGTVTNAYATGAVSGGQASSYLGGLVGNNNTGSVTNAYATGAVSGGASSLSLGGLVGVNSGNVTNAYWDVQTSGQSTSAGGTGLTTAQLQDATSASPLGGAFTLTSGLNPYLTSFFANGIQVVSGYATTNLAGSALASGANGAVTVNVFGNGTAFASATTGANGYYYAFAAAGSIAANGTVLTTINATGATGAKDTATLVTLANTSNQSEVNLTNGAISAMTSELTLSAANGTVVGAANAAAGGNSAALSAIAGSTGRFYTATGASFTIDQAVATSNLFAVSTMAGAPLTVSNAITIADGGSLGLLSGGSLSINAPIAVDGAGSVTLAYDASSATNLSFGLTGSGFTGGLTYANADGSAATASAGGTLAVNGTAYTLLYGMSDVATVNNALGGTYAVATNIDASGTVYMTGIIARGGAFFSGVFEGLGHTIANLTIDAPSNNYASLIGISSGTVRDIGVVGGSLSGAAITGGLVGYNEGSVTNAYATGAVSGGDNAIALGGLVGFNDGSVTNAYATGAVSGGDNANALGGLVGYNRGGSVTNAYATGAVSGGQGSYELGGLVGLNQSGLANSGSVTNAYATGAVSGGQFSTFLGGLVGDNIATVTNAYATGAVSGGDRVSDLGGLVGWNGGSVTNGYWDTQTSGQSTSAGGTGLTTAQLQDATSASPLGGAFTLTSGLNPYLTSFFANGIQVVSGYAATNLAGSPLASGANGAVTVNVFGNGTAFASATTGANGYYYAFAAAGSIAANAPVLTTVNANSATGAKDTATLTTLANTSNQTGVNLTNGALSAATSQLTLSAASGAVVGAANAAAGGNSAALSAIAGTTGRFYVATGASFTIDQAVTTSNLFAVSTAAGAPLTVGNAITINNGGSLGQLSGGALAINAPITVNGAGSVALAYDASSPTNLTFAQGASIDYGANNLAGTLSINSQNYALLYSMSDVEQQNTSGFNAIATNLDASLSLYTSAVVGTLNGTLEGLGHTISDLTITSNNANVGLIGNLSANGVIRDLGLVGGSVSGVGVPYVGSLVGHQNGGTIVNVYATVAVSGSQTVGGLVGGQDSGTIINVYATGAVSGTNYVGGLVGYQLDGSISNAYATGAVHGSGYVVGGLVGSDYVGTISNAYATGAVSASSYAGGLVGQMGSGTINNAYWDIQTTGQLTSAGGTGLTTAQFQTVATATDLGSAFAGGAGLYPYLKSFFPDGVQVVSGFAYQDGGVTPLASGANGAATVSIAGNGATLGSVTTGANGYYYALLAAGTLAGNSGVAAYTQANGATGAQDAVSYASGTPGQITSLDISGGWRRDTTSAASLTALDTGFDTATGGTLAGLTLPNRSIVASNDLVLDSALSVTGTLDLASPGQLTQTAAFSAGTLILEGSNATSFTLTSSGNQFGQFAASGGAINVYDAGSLTVAASLSNACGCVVTGVSATGTVRVATTGDLTIASGAAVSGDSPVLAAGGAFINNAGSAAVAANTGNWLVYSADPAANTFGGLDSGNTAIWGTAAGGTVAASGDRYVFAATRTLTVTTQNDSKTYGDDITGRVATDDAITGFDPGLAGAYLADTASTAFSGAASVTSAGAAATANVAGAPYAITASLGTLTSSSGYGFAFANSGALTVTPRGITVTADSQSRVYGDLNPTLTYSVGGLGLVNGDQLAGSLATTAGQFADVGSYGITQGSLANANYTIIGYTGANLTVNQSVLSVTANALSRSYGDANPTLTYTATGLVNNDTLTGSQATTAGQFSDVGGYGISQGTLANTNYAIRYTGAALTVTQRSLTVTADAASKTYGDANPALTYTVAGLVNNDTLTGSLATAAGQFSGVGAYGITQGSVAASSNYALTYHGSSLTVNPRTLTVTADAASRTYGDANPALTYTVAGLVNNDTLSGALATAAGQFSGVGAYGISRGSVANANYAINYTGASLTVTQRAITVAANSLGRNYGVANPTLTYTVGGRGLVNGDLLSGALATAADGSSIAGAYAITRGSLAASANYDVSFVPGTLTIDAVINPSPDSLASTLANSTIVTATPLPVTFSPPSDDGSGVRVVSADPRFDGIVICGGLNCVVASPPPRP